MTFDIISVLCAGPGLKLPEESPVLYIDNRDNRRTPCEAYQYGLEQSKADWLVYIHDDVTIHDTDWIRQTVGISSFFDRSEIAAIGLGGATSLGHPDLYKKPYDLPMMARGGYASNQTDWEVHGGHLDAPKRVAVLDAFFLAVRRDFINSCGGWPVDHLSHHCLDLYLACECARQGKETWAIPVSVTHHGGGTSTHEKYKSAKWLKGGSLETDHQEPHRWLFDSYSDVLPILL